MPETTKTTEPAPAKIHLIPKGTGAALCGAKPREGGRLAVSTAKDFGKLDAAERCGLCQRIVAGAPPRKPASFVLAGPGKIEPEEEPAPVEPAKPKRTRKAAAKPAAEPAKQAEAAPADKTAGRKKAGSTAAKTAGAKPEGVRETIWRLMQRKNGCNEREVCAELGGWKKAGATISRAIKAAPFAVRKERGEDGRTRYFGS